MISFETWTYERKIKGRIKLTGFPQAGMSAPAKA
jgi:hypothetical protein